MLTQVLIIRVSIVVVVLIVVVVIVVVATGIHARLALLESNPQTGNIYSSETIVHSCLFGTVCVSVCIQLEPLTSVSASNFHVVLQYVYELFTVGKKMRR